MISGNRKPFHACRAAKTQAVAMAPRDSGMTSARSTRAGRAPSSAIASYSEAEISRIPPLITSTLTGIEKAAVGRAIPHRGVVETQLVDDQEERDDDRLRGDRQPQQEQPEHARVIQPRPRTTA